MAQLVAMQPVREFELSFTHGQWVNQPPFPPRSLCPLRFSTRFSLASPLRRCRTAPKASITFPYPLLSWLHHHPSWHPWDACDSLRVTSFGIHNAAAAHRGLGTASHTDKAGGGGKGPGLPHLNALWNQHVPLTGRQTNMRRRLLGGMRRSHYEALEMISSGIWGGEQRRALPCRGA